MSVHCHSLVNHFIQAVTAYNLCYDAVECCNISIQDCSRFKEDIQACHMVMWFFYCSSVQNIISCHKRRCVTWDLSGESNSYHPRPIWVALAWQISCHSSHRMTTNIVTVLLFYYQSCSISKSIFVPRNKGFRRKLDNNWWNDLYSIQHANIICLAVMVNGAMWFLCLQGKPMRPPNIIGSVICSVNWGFCSMKWLFQQFHKQLDCFGEKDNNIYNDWLIAKCQQASAWEIQHWKPSEIFNHFQNLSLASYYRTIFFILFFGGAAKFLRCLGGIQFFPRSQWVQFSGGVLSTFWRWTVVTFLHTNCGVKSSLLIGCYSLHIINYVNIPMCFYKSHEKPRIQILMCIVKAHGYAYIVDDMQRVTSNEKTGFLSKVSMKEQPRIQQLPTHAIMWICDSLNVLW